MIVTLLNSLSFLRVGIYIILIVIIGCKIVLPEFINAKIPAKIISSAAEFNDIDYYNKDIEKIVQFEFFNNKSHSASYTIITHITAYHNDYQSPYFLKVSIHPPDLSLQSIA